MSNHWNGLIKKCKDLWFNRNTIPLRFPELKNKNLLLQEEIDFLLSYFKWIKRNNCAEIIGAVALNLPRDKVVCCITGKEVNFSIPFYRLYTDIEILNCCFRPNIKTIAKDK